MGIAGRAVGARLINALQCFDHGINQPGDQKQRNEGPIYVLPFIILSSNSIYPMIKSREKEKEMKANRMVNSALIPQLLTYTTIATAA